MIEASATDEKTLISLAGDVDAIITNWAKVTTGVVQAAKRCRVICRSGIGLDNIDVAAATRLGIAVTNVPDYCVAEVADHAFALLLACATAFLSLVFGNPLYLFAIASTAFIVNAVARDGETTWFEGLLLVGVYVLFALGFFFIGPA